MRTLPVEKRCTQRQKKKVMLMRRKLIQPLFHCMCQCESGPQTQTIFLFRSGHWLSGTAWLGVRRSIHWFFTVLKLAKAAPLANVMTKKQTKLEKDFLKRTFVPIHLNGLIVFGPE